MPLLDPQATILALKIPKTLTASQRRELGDLVIEHIWDRTDRGLDKNNKPFKPYSKGYLDSLDFKVAGKGKKPNLQLSGDMLAAMTVLSAKEGEIKIGWRVQSERLKAEGNILGSYGGDPSNKRSRDFLGISKSKLVELIDTVRSE